MTRVLVPSLILAAALTTHVAQGAPDRAGAAGSGAPLGLWQCTSVPQKQRVHLAVLPGGVLSFEGAGARYKLAGSTLQVLQEGRWASYPFQLGGRGAMRHLTVTMPGGQRLACQELGSGKEHQLQGMLCSYSGGSSSYAGTSSSSSTRVHFDGRGTLSSRREGSFSGPSGQFYSGGGKEQGLYRVVGNRIYLVFADGSGGLATVHLRQKSGRITEAKYRGTLFAAGLCQ